MAKWKKLSDTEGRPDAFKGGHFFTHSTRYTCTTSLAKNTGQGSLFCHRTILDISIRCVCVLYMCYVMMNWGEGNHNAAMIMKEMQCINLVLSTQQIGYFYSSVHLIILAVCNSKLFLKSEGWEKIEKRDTQCLFTRW